MSDEPRVLVLANVTATSHQLIDALTERAATSACRFTLLLPRRPDTSEAKAQARLTEALARMRKEGLEVDGSVADPDPVAAVKRFGERDEFVEIVVSTLPAGTSKWLEADVPRRIEEVTGVPVTHVEATGSGWSNY